MAARAFGFRVRDRPKGADENRGEDEKELGRGEDDIVAEERRMPYFDGKRREKMRFAKITASEIHAVELKGAESLMGLTRHGRLPKKIWGKFALLKGSAYAVGENGCPIPISMTWEKRFGFCELTTCSLDGADPSAVAALEGMAADFKGRIEWYLKVEESAWERLESMDVDAVPQLAKMADGLRKKENDMREGCKEALKREREKLSKKSQAALKVCEGLSKNGRIPLPLYQSDSERGILAKMEVLMSAPQAGEFEKAIGEYNEA